MSPINHFYVFVVNQEEEDENFPSKRFRDTKNVPALSHTQQCDELSVKCILNHVLRLLLLLLL